MQKHHNSKWCKPCALKLRACPAGRLTKKQERIARRWAGSVYGKDVAEKVGTSRANLNRWGRGNGVSFNALAYKKDVVKKVLAYYAGHGKRETEKEFPDVSVRSIVERHYGEFPPRQIRWTDKQHVQLAKFGGLISFEAQAKYFNRPNANAPSIKSAWLKRIGVSGGNTNGMSNNRAKLFVRKSCPSIDTRFWAQRRQTREFGRQLYLWVDMENHLRSDCPTFIKQAVETMAMFQRWLHDCERPQRRIRNIIRDLEVK